MEYVRCRDSLTGPCTQDVPPFNDRKHASVPSFENLEPILSTTSFGIHLASAATSTAAAISAAEKSFAIPELVRPVAEHQIAYPSQSHNIRPELFQSGATQLLRLVNLARLSRQRVIGAVYAAMVILQDMSMDIQPGTDHAIGHVLRYRDTMSPFEDLKVRISSLTFRLKGSNTMTRQDAIEFIRLFVRGDGERAAAELARGRNVSSEIPNMLRQNLDRARPVEWSSQRFTSGKAGLSNNFDFGGVVENEELVREFMVGLQHLGEQIDTIGGGRRLEAYFGHLLEADLRIVRLLWPSSHLADGDEDTTET